MAQIRLLAAGDEALFARVADGVFDNAAIPELIKEFLGDPRHHIVVALEDGMIVGFASGVHYVHPDKATELWVNEVGVGDEYRKRGLARQVLQALLDHGRAIGCNLAWVLTDTDNEAARALYASVNGKELSHNTVHIEFPL